jgi:hypothetical protein
MRSSVARAVEYGAPSVRPAHLLLGLIAEPRVGRALRDLVPLERVRSAAEAEGDALPKSVDLQTLAFCSPDGRHTLYLDHDAARIFIEGAQRAAEAFGPKALALGFVAEALKDQEILGFLGGNPERITAALAQLPPV